MTDQPQGNAGPWQTYGWLMWAVWLVFLAFPLIAVVTADRSPALRAFGVVALVAFGALYFHWLLRLFDVVDRRRSELSGLLHLGGLVLLTVPGCVVIGAGGLGTLPFIVAGAVTTMRLRWVAPVLVLAVALPLLGPELGLFDERNAYIVVIAMIVALITGLVRFIDARDFAHQRIQQEYELVAERERVARDVHDVLGHSLTVVAAKAELAERTLDDDPERTRDELRQIQSLTREAIAEIRATVAGLRVARLADELVSARDALAAAGIDADVPTETAVVDPRHRLVLAWVLREAVTNVVRHSGARSCEVVLTHNGLRVFDDGRGIDGVVEGNGLRGIRERVAAAGGTIEVGAGEGGHGTRLEVTW